MFRDQGRGQEYLLLIELCVILSAVTGKNVEVTTWYVFWICRIQLRPMKKQWHRWSESPNHCLKKKNNWTEFPSLLQVCPTFPAYQASLSTGQSPYHSLSFSTEQAPRFQYVVEILTAVDSTNRNLMTFLVYSSDPAQRFQSLTVHAFFFFFF